METKTFQQYQSEVTRTLSGDREPDLQLATFGLGLGGEAGEVQDILKKHLGHGHPLDREKVAEELGDLLWYLGAIAETLDLDLGMIADLNIQKLRRRYPDGFSSAASIARVDTGFHE